MTARAGKEARKSRFVPDHAEHRSITPLGLTLLRLVGRFGFLSAVQLSHLSGLSPQAVRRLLRRAFDTGLVSLLPIPRLALADPTDDLSAHIYGSAPNFYTLTAAGLLAVGDPSLRRYRIGSWTQIAHEIGVRDSVIWFARAARQYGHDLPVILLGGAATVDLCRSAPPLLCRPDALLRYAFAERSLVAAVEFDRNSEREPSWELKLKSYAALLASDLLAAKVGAAFGRVVVITPTVSRRDRLARQIATQAPLWLAERFYLADLSVLETPGPTLPVWRRPGSSELAPLIPPQLLEGACADALTVAPKTDFGSTDTDRRL